MVRKAKTRDVPQIHALLSEFSSQGALLSRPLSRLYDNIRDFFVFVSDSDDSMVIGCCALQVCWEDLAEIRSLAVRSDWWGKGVGTALVKHALADAVDLEIREVFALTYVVPFFEKHGFVKTDRSNLPLKIWADCIECVKFPDCDETAMIKKL